MKTLGLFGAMVGVIIMVFGTIAWCSGSVPLQGINYATPRLSTLPSSPVPVNVVESGTEESVTLLFGGDLMFDRYIRTQMNRFGADFPLAELRTTLAQADMVIANLEGPITEQPSVSETSVIGARENYIFTFDPAVAQVLRDAPIDLVNLGNNHILNFGEEGVKTTHQALDRAGVAWFGSPLASDDTRFFVRDIRGTRVAFVNYNQFGKDGRSRAFADIARANTQADFVVLYTHWGTEYVPVTEATRALAHRFVEAGVDVLIGSHPHVVQEHEVYQGKPIYYSLGNFVFDQYFDTATQQGLLVRVSLKKETGDIETEEIPIVLEKSGQTSLASQRARH